MRPKEQAKWTKILNLQKEEENRQATISINTRAESEAIDRQTLMSKNGVISHLKLVARIS